MWHIPKNVKPEVSQNVAYQFVTGSYIVKDDDLVRRTCYSGYSDDISYDAIESMNWEKASTCFPAWIGRSVDEIKSRLGDDYEIMRKITLTEKSE